jgi:hypothetical protein
VWLDERSASAGWRIIGDWHTHPSWGGTEPSTRDTETWCDAARGLKQHYVGLLLTADPDVGWDRPQWSAHIAYHGDGSCRPVPVVFEPEVY